MSLEIANCAILALKDGLIMNFEISSCLNHYIFTENTQLNRWR
jgi:hypothetical protein